MFKKKHLIAKGIQYGFRFCRRDTHGFDQMLRHMRASQAQIRPALELLQDNTLHLKHSLNANAISELNAATELVHTRVARLIAEMERSIEASQQFIDAR